MENLTAKQNAIQSTETTATVLHALLYGQYGDDVYDWDPLTVALEVKADFGVELSSASLDRWCAMQIVMTSDAFFKKLDAFMAICNTLCLGKPFFGVFDPVTAEEAAWAIAETALNRDMLPFSRAVKTFITVLLDQYGYNDSRFPEIFEPVFDKKSDFSGLRESIATLGNDEALSGYINDQLSDIAAQFGGMPDVRNVFGNIISKADKVEDADNIDNTAILEDIFE